MRRRFDAAAWGWVTILAFAGAFDVWLVRTGRRTLSSAFAEGGYGTRIAGVALLAHLCRVLPRHLDPFHHAGKVVGR